MRNRVNAVVNLDREAPLNRVIREARKVLNRNRFKVGTAALNQTPFDWINNRATIESAIGAARAKNVQMLLLPELSTCGYGTEDRFFGRGIARRSLEMVLAIAPLTKGMVVSLGLPVYHKRKLYNGAALLVDGKLVGIACKKNLAGDGVHYEPRWFKPWDTGVVAYEDFDLGTGPLLDSPIPIGDIYFNIGGILVGFEICEDAWTASRPGAQLANKGVDFLLNPSASHFAFGKSYIRQQLVEEGSRAFAAIYMYANLLGNEAGRVIYDGDCLVAAAGRLVARGRRFSYAAYELTTAVVDVDEVRGMAQRTSSFRTDPRPDPSCIVVDFHLTPTVERVSEKPALERWERSSNLKEEEFSRAVALGLWDYLRKSKANGFLVSLSGGADSTATVSLVYLMARFADRQLGPIEGTLRLGRATRLLGRTGKLNPKLLTCVYQSTENSGRKTKGSARATAKAVGARYGVLNVQPMFEAYIEETQRFLKHNLSWDKHDLALQNLQARVRSPGPWTIANVLGLLFLTTSNRSEASVGYCTMDGDTSGGLNPIGGIDKAFLRQWLVWAEKKGPQGIGKLSFLSHVNALTPTAELRPSRQNQTDEDDLMPYDVLNEIERLAIRQWEEPLDVYFDVRQTFPDYSAAQIYSWVKKFFLLWSRNQWKRERFAISFHLDDRNVDPKTWCRFPNLNGGFEVELQELEQEFKKAA